MPVTPWGAIISAGVSLYSASRSRRAAKKSSANALEFKKEQQALLEEQKEAYRGMEFKNPYTNIQNPFEDMTVNQQQAEFMSEQGTQQRADILGGLRQAAGGSGIAALAQSMANQGQLESSKIGAIIGQQESNIQQQIAQGASAIDMAERGGVAALQQAEMSRQATLLGMQAGQTAGANNALQSAYANQMQSNAYSQQSTMSALSNIDWDSAFSSGGTGTPVGLGDLNTTWDNYPGNPINQ
tara:strand:+ start:62 stop:784 length:723 start_codon:yes stop_codon:yes gene_type:complete